MNMKRKSNFSFLSQLLLCCTMISLILISCKVEKARGQDNNQTTGGKRLKVAVPVKDGFTEFVSQKLDPATSESTFGGYSIDIFKAAVNSDLLSSPISFDFVPFAKPDGTMNGSYDDMVKAVFSKDYDAAAGDITIRYYRTQWVDFTLPYSDSGVSMLVPQQLKASSERGSKFSTRLAYGLVVPVVVVCVVMALLFWFKEYTNYRETDQERGHRSATRTRLATLLCFLVLVVLSTCFISLLVTMLTAERPTPPVANIDDLIRRNRKVGYQEGSFVKNLLTQRGFSDSQLKSYATTDEIQTLLSKGTSHGGVDAVIDETPYLKLFLTQHCNGYALVPSATLQGDGFGFAFPKGSPLVRDVSNAILKVTNGDQLTKIKERTIGDLEACQVNSMYANNVNFIDWPRAQKILIVGAIGVLALLLIFVPVYFAGNDRTGLGRWSQIAFPCYFCCSSR